MKNTLAIISITFGLALAGCQTAKNVGDDTEHVAKKAGHTVGHATEKVGDTISHGGKKLENKTEQ